MKSVQASKGTESYFGQAAKRLWIYRELTAWKKLERVRVASVWLLQPRVLLSTSVAGSNFFVGSTPVDQIAEYGHWTASTWAVRAPCFNWLLTKACRPAPLSLPRQWLAGRQSVKLAPDWLAPRAEPILNCGSVAVCTVHPGIQLHSQELVPVQCGVHRDKLCGVKEEKANTVLFRNIYPLMSTMDFPLRAKSPMMILRRRVKVGWDFHSDEPCSCWLMTRVAVIHLGLGGYCWLLLSQVNQATGGHCGGTPESQRQTVTSLPWNSSFVMASTGSTTTAPPGQTNRAPGWQIKFPHSDRVVNIDSFQTCRIRRFQLNYSPQTIPGLFRYHRPSQW